MSLSYAQLGPYPFTVLKSYESRSRDDRFTYPQHDLIEGKPILQWTGDDLIRIKLSIQLHVKFCDPDAEAKALRDAAATHQALRYVLNTGEVVGEFVIQSMQEVTHVTDQNHRTIWAKLDLDLVEYVPGEQSAPLTGPGIAKNIPPKQAIPARNPWVIIPGETRRIEEPRWIIIPGQTRRLPENVPPSEITRRA